MDRKVRNIVDHLHNAVDELKLAEHAAREAGEDETADVIEEMIEDAEAEIGVLES